MIRTDGLLKIDNFLLDRQAILWYNADTRKVWLKGHTPHSMEDYFTPLTLICQWSFFVIGTKISSVIGVEEQIVGTGLLDGPSSTNVLHGWTVEDAGPYFS